MSIMTHPWCRSSNAFVYARIFAPYREGEIRKRALASTVSQGFLWVMGMCATRIAAQWHRTYTEFRFCVQNSQEDRKSTRLNSSHVAISYAVFCLKKKSCND